MEKTLYARIKELRAFFTYAQEHTIDIDKEDHKAAKQKIVSRFYNEDPIAKDVAQQRISYQELAEPILNTYEGFWNKVLIPKKDAGLDTRVREIAQSMHNVGRADMKLRPQNLAPTNRRKNMLLHQIIGFGIGALFTAFTYASTADMPEFHESMNERLYLLKKLSPGIIFPATYTLTKIISYLDVQEQLEELAIAADVTDEFIRSVSPKKIPTRTKQPHLHLIISNDKK